MAARRRQLIPRAAQVLLHYCIIAPLDYYTTTYNNTTLLHNHSTRSLLARRRCYPGVLAWTIDPLFRIFAPNGIGSGSHQIRSRVMGWVGPLVGSRSNLDVGVAGVCTCHSRA